MMDAKVSSMLINGIEYVPKGSENKTQPSGSAKIVILQRGWVMIGRLERNGSECKLKNAHVIRIWGTSKGLGEIASGGPTSKTVLDDCGGVVEFDYNTVVAAISVEERKWEKYL